MSSYAINEGDVGDALYSNQVVNTFREHYLIEGCNPSLGGSTTAIETHVDSGIVRFGNDVIAVDAQTVTHPDGDPDDPRIDVITIDTTGSAGRVIGTPARARIVTPPSGG